MKNPDQGLLVISPVANRALDTVGFLAILVAYYLKPSMAYDEWVSHIMLAQSNPLDHAIGRIENLPYHQESGFAVTPFFCEWRSGGTWFDDVQLYDVAFTQREYKCFHITMSEVNVGFTYFWTRDLLNILFEEIIHPTNLNKFSLLRRFQPSAKAKKNSEVN